MQKYYPGAVVNGTVVGIKPYGAFISLEDNISGLLHISEITEKFVKDVNSYAKIGESIYVEIKEKDDEKKKCILTVKGLNYRIDDTKKVKESVRGFTPLKQHLPIWIEEKYKEIHKEDKQNN